MKVVGDELDIDGKLLLKGIVRDAKEPQRQFNFMKSAATEAIALAPKAPFVIAEGQLEGYERQWAQANTKSFAYLQYKPTTVGGQPAPPPQRMNAEPAIQAINMAMMESTDDLKAVTGIYDASLGAQGNETSGKAILARQQQAQGANFHYIDNLTRAMRHCGRILLDLIPKIYDTPRIIRILGEDGAPSMAAIGQQQQLSPEQTAQWQGYERIYDLGLGTYDVTISTGPSYHSRRQEAVSSIIDLTKSYPPLMNMAGDILVKNMDWPGAQEIAKRLHTMLPPQIQQESNGNPQLPPQIQQTLAQQTETIQK
ncbi:portal protein, partial [Terriglobus sp. YAF25]|uniref:portal protein n=1 Tax=Terriglobus sp. YAF25 TaxID=3233080 RepID=UPI003F96E222